MLTRLELVIRQRQLRPKDIAASIDFSRYHLLRVRLGLREPSRRFIEATTAAISRLSHKRVKPDDLFERASEFLATDGSRLRNVHARDLRVIDDMLRLVANPDWPQHIVDAGLASETVVRHLYYIGKPAIDQQPAYAAAVLFAAAKIAASLPQSTPELSAALQAHALKTRANALRHLARFDDALADLRAAADFFLQARYCNAEAGQVHYTRGTVFMKMERWVEATKATRYARRLFAAAKDARRVAHCDILLGIIQFEQGDWDSTRHTWLRLAKQLETLGDREALARVWLNLAVVEIRRNKPFDARKYLTRASAAFRSLGNKTELARVRWNMGTYLAAFVSPRAGLFALNRARVSFQSLGLWADAGCVGLDAVELMAKTAPAGDEALAAYAADVANTLLRAGLNVSATLALDQLRRISYARDRSAVIGDLRAALRDLDLSCDPTAAAADEAEVTDPDLAADC